jgi:LysR family glycine cleavage system transcriptional activator
MPILAEADLNVARLVTPFELRVPLESAYYLVCSPEAAARPSVAAFREWLLAEAVRDGEKGLSGVKPAAGPA